MKAAVMYQKGDAPLYEEFPEPVAQNEDQLLIRVKASAIKNVDRSIASGSHYSAKSQSKQPGTVIGSDGVGLLADGTRVYTVGRNGMVAFLKEGIIPKPQW
jgi:NADPH:quinone reductase-like Zn-dependent oxidoreductase